MKIEKWTLGLAAVGLVTLSPALLAQAAAPLNPVQTALTATTISGYVDTSAEWNPGTGNANPAPYAFNAGKQDGFNLDSVDLRIEKPLDDQQWSAGYVAEISLGPDAIASDAGAYPIRQAYVNLRMPIGNGIDWELGRWDSLLGYESTDSYKNPNFTRSYGKTFEPTENTGLLGSYKFSDEVSLAFGVADTVSTLGVNARSAPFVPQTGVIESKKAILSLLTLTAPDSWGSFKGSTLAAGIDDGEGDANFNLAGTPIHPHARTQWYIGTTINTPVKDLTFGASYDGIEHADVGGLDSGSFEAFAGYASYKLAEKWTVSGRLEYANGLGLGALTGTGPGSTATPGFDKVLDATATLQYDLWANVVSRLEIRWDHAADGTDPFGASSVAPTPSAGGTKKNEVMIAANVIYKF